MKILSILSVYAFAFLLAVSLVSATYGVNVNANANSNSDDGSLAVNANVKANVNNSENRNMGGESKEDIIARVNLRTGLNISLEENQSLGSALRVQLSNGRYASIKVLPAEASLKAQEVLKAKCEERNCTVELKEARVNGETKATYEVKAEKRAKVLGVFPAKMGVQANVDAETGEVISTNKPWWASISSETDENVSA